MPICTPSSSDSSSGSSSMSIKLWVIHSLVVGAAAAVALVAPAYLKYRRSRRFRNRVVGIIPARFASSRFQGKPLVHILGEPMIQRTWERAKMASLLDHVVVATNDNEIAECCREFGADVIMTSESCRDGTERCNEAHQKLGNKYDIIVNIQGDEPLVEPEIIDGIVKALQGFKEISLVHMNLMMESSGCMLGPIIPVRAPMVPRVLGLWIVGLFPLGLFLWALHGTFELE